MRYCLLNRQDRAGWHAMLGQSFQCLFVSWERLKPCFNRGDQFALVPAASPSTREPWIIDEFRFAEGLTDVGPLAIKGKDYNVAVSSFEDTLRTGHIVMNAVTH